MKNRTLIVAALVMVLLCVGLIFLGLRHENAGGGSPGQSQTADGDTQSQAQQDITATPGRLRRHHEPPAPDQRRL